MSHPESPELIRRCTGRLFDAWTPARPIDRRPPAAEEVVTFLPDVRCSAASRVAPFGKLPTAATLTPHGRPRINLTLSGVLVKALVDTGATCFLLQRNVYQTIARASHRSLFVQPAPNLQGVNGQVVTVVGETELRIDHVRKPVKFRIVDDLNQDMILGCDVLAGAQIDLSRRLLTMHGHRWPLYSNDIGLAGLG